jgi:hypothetical protein
MAWFDGFPAAGSGSHALGEVGDAVAEGVGGVVVGQRGLACRAVQDPFSVVAGLVQGGQLGGKDGQARITGEGGHGVDEARDPVPDAGFGDFELVVELALGLPFGRRPAEWPRRP